MGMNFNVSSMKARLNNTVDRDPSKIHLNPERDWLFLLGLFFVLTAGVSIYAYDVFIGVYNDDGYHPADDSEVQHIRYERFQNELTATLEYYQQKEIAFNELLEEGPMVFGDPSAAFVPEEEIVIEGDPVLTQ